ncbi:hypothetical protein EPO15_14635 [bacterium]|nr:MAG: hypothetical protein EPO15_14635 [bacterium]
MPFAPALALLTLLAAPSYSQVKREDAKAAPPALPQSAVPGAAAGGKAYDGAAAPGAPSTPPAVEGRRVGPSTKGPIEPEPSLEPSLLAAPVAVDKPLFDKLVTHVRKFCSPDDESGLCCLSGQAPLKKGAPNRTACLDVQVPQEEGDVHYAVYRETFVGLTLLSTTALPKEKRVEQVTLEVAMDGSVTQVEISSEGTDGLQHRANPMKAGETEPLFTAAAKDLLLITPRVKI